MQQLKLENKDIILKYLSVYAEKNKIDSLSAMENIYKIIIGELEHLDGYDNFVFDLKDKLKKDTIFETEEELYHVVSWELDKQYTELVLSNSDKNDVEEVFKFLDTNYYEIFKTYYDKKGYVSEKDYHECVASIYNNFTLEKEVADILVGKWLEDKIINS